MREILKYLVFEPAEPRLGKAVALKNQSCSNSTKYSVALRPPMVS